MSQRGTNQTPADEDGPPHPADDPRHGGNGGVATMEEAQPRPLAMAPILGPPGSQATQVQMAAAIAAVQAMVVTAKAHKRHLPDVMDEVLVACDQPFMAEQAFYDYSRGDGRVRGITVQLARELLRCFGNARSGIEELQRLPATGTEPARSEMRAFAWDLQTNTEMSTVFWVDHVRDRSAAKGGPVALTAGRDVYENNANMASRRERAMIERLLPAWLVEMAKERCMATLRGDAKTLPARIEACVQKFDDDLGVGLGLLEAKVGRPREVWGGPDLANLLVTYRTMERGEQTREEAFGDLPTSPAKVTDAALAGESAPATTSDAGTAPPPADPTAGGQAARDRDAALLRIQAAFRQAKLAENSKAARETRRRVVAMLAREDQTVDPPPPVQSATDLDATQAIRVADRLDAILADAGQDTADALNSLAVGWATWQEGGSNA